DPRTALASYQDTFSKYKASPLVEEGLVSRAKQWKAQGYRGLAFDLPVDQSMRNLERTVSGYREEWMRRQLEEAGVDFVSTPLEGYQSYDGSHLAAPSAEKFSALLGGELFRMLGKGL